MNLGDMRRSDIEKKIKDLLLNSNKGIGVLIDYKNFFLVPLQKEGFNPEEILDVVRGLEGLGYFNPYQINSLSSAELKLTQKGRDEWLLDKKEILEIKPNFHGISLDLKQLFKKIWNKL